MMISAKMHEPTPIITSPTKKPTTFAIKKKNYKTSRIFRGF